METEILQPTQENLLRAAELIRAGELVAFPTETVYGLGADGLNFSARKKIYTAKGRPSAKPITLHVANLEQVAQVAEISPAAEKLFAKFCPGPLTLILPKKNSAAETVGIRFPDNKIALDFIKLCGVPIAASSANISDCPPPKNAQEVFDNLRGKVKIILDGGEVAGVSSTVFDLATKKILRLGAVTEKNILEVLDNEE